jgi:hypothetical protein
VRPALAGMLAATLAWNGCGHSSSPRSSDTPELIHSPPIKGMSPDQLKALSRECENYLPGQFARGPYDAAYCQAAIDAWGDSPIQMIQIPDIRIPNKSD